MGSIRAFNPVKLFVGVLVSEAALIPRVEQRLESDYGPVDYRSEALPFNFTHYYRAETGNRIQRLFLSFERLIQGDQLPQIKRRTNEFEEEFTAAGSGVKRPVNLDPGYLENSKVVLASTKNFFHRMYLGGGIFGEVTMHFRNNSFQFFPWTYPDYQSAEYQKFFLGLRHVYRGQLRSVCLINRE